MSASRGPGPRLLVSTFTRLLRVQLDEALGLADVSVWHEGQGIYFGLTAGEDGAYVLARNADVNRRPLRAELPGNRILRLRPLPEGGVPEATECAVVGRGSNAHQIRLHEGALWVATGPAPELRAFDPATGAVLGGLALSALVPEDLRHEPLPEHPDDRYHFNSLHFADGRLFVLAHNWDRPSFVLELVDEGGLALLDRPALVEVHRDVGRTCHDVFVTGEQRIVLSGGDHALLGTRHGPLPIDDAGTGAPVFPRGLAVDGRRYFVGWGVGTLERGRREDGPTGLSVLDRESGATLATHVLGEYGNSCDVLLLGGDLNDR